MENEKETLAMELIERNNEVVALKVKVARLQQNIDSHICVVDVPNNP